MSAYLQNLGACNGIANTKDQRMKDSRRGHAWGDMTVRPHFHFLLQLHVLSQTDALPSNEQSGPLARETTEVTTGTYSPSERGTFSPANKGRISGLHK